VQQAEQEEGHEQMVRVPAKGQMIKKYKKNMNRVA
jgi:hypothetical protein